MRIRSILLLAVSLSVASAFSQQSRLLASNGLAVGSLTPEATCISEKLAVLYESCTRTSQLSAQAKAQASWASLVRLLQNCLFNTTTAAGTAKQPVRFLVSQSNFGDWFVNLTKVYSQMTNVPIQVQQRPSGQLGQIRVSSIANAMDYNKTHESWILSVSGIGDSFPALKRLTQLVGFDPRLDWPGLMPVLRTNALLYKSEVVTLPSSVFTYHLAYRKDIFAQYNLTLPRTWRELLQFSRQYNGTAGMHAFCTVWGPCFQMGVVLLRYMLASYTQTHGPSQGWFFDPDTVKLMFDSPAMTELVDIMKDLYFNSPPDNSSLFGCPAYNYRFTGPTGGQCLMSIIHPVAFKYASYGPRKDLSANLQGNFGFAPWPGAEVVLDKPTNTLVPCDTNRCPHATRYTNPDGSTVLVNQSPGFEASLFALNRFSPPDVSFFSFSVASFASAAKTTNDLIYSPDAEIFPARLSQLTPQPWIRAGFHPDDSHAFCADSVASLNHPNLNIQIRMPGASQLVTLFGTTVNRAFAGVPTSEVVAQAAASARAILNNSYPSAEALRAEYFASINRQMPASPPPPRPPLVPPAPMAAQASGDAVAPGVIAASVVVPTVVVLGALAALAYGLRKRWLWRHEGATKNPGPGPETTLCVTDIENSTLLWEELDAQVMDTAVKTHNVCMRKLAAKYKGYESLWEGDSFILAFPCPVSAIEFCMAAQQELLHLAWPTALLQSPSGCEVWCIRNVKKTKDQKGSTKAGKRVTLLEPERAVGLSSSRPDSNSNSNGQMSSKSQSGWNSMEGYTVPLASAHSTGSDLASTKFENGNLLESNCTFDAKSGGDSDGETESVFLPKAPSVPASVSMVAPASESGSGLIGETETGALATLGAHWAAVYVKCAPGTSAAILAYRGLRVRMGLHSGVASTSNIAYNTAMGRYHYTGPVRVISNVVASAGHGGQTLISAQTAALLGTSPGGTLARLPSACSVFYMGTHQLSGVAEDMDLILLLPDALRCRLGLQQDMLRTQQTVLAGVCTAPMPDRRPLQASAALAYVHFTGLETLAAWNAAESAAALRSAGACAAAAVRAWRGVKAADLLTHPALTSAESICAALHSAQEHTHSGHFIAAFHSAHSAVQFGVSLREQLLALDWSAELLSHELCEYVGMAGEQQQQPLQPESQQGKLPVTTGEYAFLTSDGPALSPVGNESARRPSNDGSIFSVDSIQSHHTEALRARHGTGRFASVVSLAPVAGPSRRDMLRRAAGAFDAMPATVTLEALGLRGLRARMVVLSAAGARASVARRSSGYVTYSGPDKTAAKLLKKAAPGQIVIDKSLVQRQTTLPGRKSLAALKSGDTSR